MSDAPANAAPGPPSIWARPERGSRGPTPAHSRDAIAAAGIALADADGIAAVSMRAVATALGTSAGSLYRYLSSRDDLLELMTDRAIGELRPHPSGDDDWLAAMLRLAHRQLALYGRHPWLLDVLPHTSAAGPESLAWFDTCLRILEPVDCATAAKFEAIAMTTGVVGLFARHQAGSSSFAVAGVDLTAYPHLAAAFSRPVGAPPRADLFDRTLRILLTGLLVDDRPDHA
ncbi:TetR/AcrR family transcriptional regulator [Micromonospora siamensis]|uniref:DNA-binding transcriptional regulator, AcrR family n=1 Tax=Micromonospora siamensis TaxID=299152 RepID=A0A1C5J8N5_9ACTN|nr:TetR/AcrR family transcriptional regulator [Micromonospora siamensis]SCG66925.1 DNA-binding transcriptional regulator, AcrR family [Micromonospora siamensis]